MLSRVFSCTTIGLEPHLVEVEVDVGNGLPCFELVGLPDTTVRESKERVRTAIKNAGFDFPPRRIIVNLAPADLKKAGPGFDLAIAIGILAATRQICEEEICKYVIVGELSLDGKLRRIPGILPMALFLVGNGCRSFIIPADNRGEAGLTPLDSYGFNNLAEVGRFLSKTKSYPMVKKTNTSELLQDRTITTAVDFADVKGQNAAKRALEVAAAGGHNILMIGPPGSGKTMLAQCMPAILPPLTTKEALEISQVYSIAGLLSKEIPLVTNRPFRTPHHSASLASMIGGGALPRPGEVTLATHGVLFLDEFPEYRRDVLESLRQPLEDGVVTVARVSSVMTYPARFQLVAAANPCYCGYYTDPVRECTCTPYQIKRYRNKISGPLMDRIDLHVEVPRLSYQALNSTKGEEKSKTVRRRVVAARERQIRRYASDGVYCNAQMGAKERAVFCLLEDDAKLLLKEAFKSLGLSTRAYACVLRMARTIADLAGVEMITDEHIAEALLYRSFERNL